MNGHRWNGYEKEYDLKGNLLFGNEYLNGMKTGIKKEYNEKKKVIFEGEYMNGQRWKGYEKEYNLKGNLLFEIIINYYSRTNI